jgi:Kdo2-lipid IVA lauroyltransferase/acyltransferase
LGETNSNKLRFIVSVQNKIEFILFIAFVKFFNTIGLKSARKFSIILAFLFYYIIPIRKAVVKRNLSIAFPELNKEEISNLAYKSFKSVCIALVEIFSIPTLSKEEIKNLVSFPGIESAKKIYDEKRGGILLTAHYGNWELGAASVGIHLGVPVYLIAKAQRNDFVSKWLNDMRESAGNKVEMLGVSIKNVFRQLLNKNIIGIVGDQRGPNEGLRVEFFNRKTAVYNGAAMFSIKTGAPIFVSIMVRQPDYKYISVMEVIDPLDFAGSDEEKIQQITQKFMYILECYIRKYPEQWFWMHNIWKY